jgi:hypothetical protein
VLFSLRDVNNDYRLIAKNEDFGEIRTFIIDSMNWVLRYVVVRVGSRDVLLSTHAFGKFDVNNKTLSLNVSREKVINSPEINLNRRISSEMERQVYDYYQWPYDWESDSVPETQAGDLSAIPLIEMELEREQQMVPQTGADTRLDHIFSTDHLFDYNLYASNDEQNAGTLHDLIINDAGWRVMYMIVDTNGLFPGGRKIALAPTWVTEIDEVDGRIMVDLQEDTIKDSPEYRTIEDLEA